MLEDAAMMEAIAHSQRIARQVGANLLAVDVFGWAIKHSANIPAPALKELMDMVTGGDK